MALSWNKVVVPIDFSDESFAALDWAFKLTEDAKKISVIHVLAELHTDADLMRDAISHEERERHAESKLRAHLEKSNYNEVAITIRIGDPGNEIARFAQEIGAELIVLPSHGRTGLSHLLIGSVAERVVRLAHCPVLVLRQ